MRSLDAIAPNVHWHTKLFMPLEFGNQFDTTMEFCDFLQVDLNSLVAPNQKEIAT